LYDSSVDNRITDTDVLFIKKFLGDHDYKRSKGNYSEELEFINFVQRSVQNHVVSPGIPTRQEREPKDVFQAKRGLCYDKSRVIEKILRHFGFNARHVMIITARHSNNKFVPLITPGISSHAVTEVLTSRGWLVVDSNRPWVSIDIEGNPVSIEKISEDADDVSYSEELKDDYPFLIYKDPFVYVYGLYSRHGKFYPPYNFIPDINYREFWQNFF